MGKLIVIEGTDGSGKSTQFRLLTGRLESEQVKFQKLVFPQYSEPSSALIRMYLGGEFGKSPSDVNAYAASAFYSVDRYASYRKVWGKWYEEGGLVVSDRYTTSNAVHQASKEPEDKRENFLNWLYDFEYDKLGLPRPDLVLFLSLPLELSQQLLAKRYHGDASKKDIHEADLAYLVQCTKAAAYAGEKLGWHCIPCSDGSRLYPIPQIRDSLRQTIREVLGC